MRRIIGFFLLFLGLAGIGLSIGGVVVGQRLIDEIGLSLEDSLLFTANSLTTLEDSLQLTKTTLTDVNKGLDTLEATALNTGQSVSQTRPLLDQIALIASHDVPNNIDAVQTALPDMAQVAGTVDETLRSLSNFNLNQNILGIPLSFDLNIDYDPAQPLDQSINEISHNLTGLSKDFRKLESNFEITSQNIDLISQDIVAISEDLEVINSRLAEFDPLLGDYIKLVGEIKSSLIQTRTTLRSRLEFVKLGLVVLMIWLGLNQIIPLYLGWELVRGQRNP